MVRVLSVHDKSSATCIFLGLGVEMVLRPDSDNRGQYGSICYLPLFPTHSVEEVLTILLCLAWSNFSSLCVLSLFSSAYWSVHSTPNENNASLWVTVKEQLQHNTNRVIAEHCNTVMNWYLRWKVGGRVQVSNNLYLSSGFYCCSVSSKDSRKHFYHYARGYKLIIYVFKLKYIGTPGWKQLR